MEIFSFQLVVYNDLNIPVSIKCIYVCIYMWVSYVVMYTFLCVEMKIHIE